MRSVKRTVATRFSCKAVSGGPERVPLWELLFELGLADPLPSQAALGEILARGRARIETPGRRCDVSWKPFRLGEQEYAELLDLLSGPTAGSSR
jgi:hypothetical protein